MRTHLSTALTLLLCACGNGGGATSRQDAGPITPAPAGECGSVRLTGYDAQARGWCEWDRTAAFLPDVVRAGMTLAIAEPWNGGSYAGDPGEACGECWEVATNLGREIVMVHDLCPIEGNPLCSGGHFHMDLSNEAAESVGGALFEGTARRVPCPVDGGIRLQVNDSNEWGYLRFAPMNHRLPIRRVEYRATDGTTYRDAERSGGAWHVLEDNVTFAEGGPGGIFRLTSASGEVIEATNSVGARPSQGARIDLGAQFDPPADPPAGMCVYAPPGEVYVDAWGGIDGVNWRINPWGSITATETSDGCLMDRCLRLDDVDQWTGAHVDYRQGFTLGSFSALEFDIRTDGASGEIQFALSLDGERCAQRAVAVSGEWAHVVISDFAGACAAFPTLGGFTLDNGGAAHGAVFLDNVRFLP